MNPETLGQLIAHLYGCMEVGWEGLDPEDEPVRIQYISNMIDAPASDGVNAGIRIGFTDETGTHRAVELVARELI